MPLVQFARSALLARMSLTRQRFLSLTGTQAVSSNADRCTFESWALLLRSVQFPRRQWRPFANLLDQCSGCHSPKSLNAMSGPLKNSAVSFCEIQNLCHQPASEFATYAVESVRFRLVARAIPGALDQATMGFRCSLLSVCEIVPNRYATAGQWL